MLKNITNPPPLLVDTNWFISFVSKYWQHPKFRTVFDCLSLTVPMIIKAKQAVFWLLKIAITTIKQITNAV